MLVGYARVSSVGQSLDVQLDALSAAGCEKIFSEKQSGTSIAKRSELAEAISYVRDGDTLVVTRLDRLARSAVDLHSIVKQLSDKGVGFQCIQQSQMDTTTSTGKLLLGVLASIAEFEADIRRERQREGIERAKEAGVYKGRKPSVDVVAVRKLHAQGLGGTAIAKRLGIGRASVYRAISRE
ncbi:MAG TPA: recombinase family protein [Pararhizobium sp.]|uniref:recombinase family protein n=1 Tax=Pararhizobium sp. TaxID=1977563 RepID=UPI002C42ED05|nr:recombinase family protein [Pararhizobium sp.]HTO32599.1 recombinase family protein [Pararhizobium sp.]